MTPLSFKDKNPALGFRDRHFPISHTSHYFTLNIYVKRIRINNMKQIQFIFEHYSQYRIMICKQCRNGIVRSQLFSHLRNHHRGISKIVKRNMISAATSMSDWAENDARIKFPTGIIELIPHLSLWQDDLKCILSKKDNELCNFICRGIKNIHTHCRKYQSSFASLLKYLH